MDLYRLFPGHYRETAFTGVGGLYAARRWNHLGTLMVYAATSRALAALECFVHLDPNDSPVDLLMAEAEIPDELVTDLDLASLPENWRELDNRVCRDLGTEWARSGRSAALRVPSVVIEGDWNLLLNPRHTDFSRMEIRSFRPFHFDERMFR
jgi:RES domain-containing protein